VWDLATGALKFALAKQHAHAVRGLGFSARHAYLFSCSEDKEAKCLDLETKQVVRQYHGHESGVYALALHPKLDLLVTGGRDRTVRVWDIRTRTEVFQLRGHKDAVTALVAQGVDPQVVSGSEDATVRLWDLTAGRTAATLTYHKRGVRSLALHPDEFSFCAGSTASLKKFALPEGRFMMDMPMPAASATGAAGSGVVSALAVNRDGVLVAGTDAGSLRFWDWRSGAAFHDEPLRMQPGSLESENYVTALAFDVTGSRLFTCNGDKSIQTFCEVG